MKKNLLNYKGLYGDNNQRDFGDFVHHELLATRSKLYDWEINEHLHTDLFQIFMISSGEGVLIQDTKKISLKAPCILLIPTNTFHGFEFQSDVTGEVFTISEQFIETIFKNTPLILLELNKAKQYSFDSNNFNLNDFIYLKNKIIQAISENNRYKQISLQSLFQLFFIGLHHLDNAVEDQKETSNNRTLGYFHAFQKLIKRTLPESKLIKEYAQELRITPVHLNRVCHTLVQKTALQVVHEYGITEAKKYLLYSSYSISEISYLLHFKDPAYFSRLFKKQTGQSPNAFRSNNSPENRN
ncbi:helix-turn-helix domain-containing protein [Flavobacterium franklandianum]|uniref:Helix-turn-helix domain-containing protein n=1 Tax=Flavobacterium franklandianum TaxID=2594430 RepID=A0A553CLP6_9FLAO|nr:helix-turn-helix domain-containing protein [Flavobacterium franklandianum]TRX21367.1 helix-turn-helix domain-containing protein [Flavobacterium franklandianum]TRX29987.1 helix-turn-helix domain-containing protein [Flavobacterium franklandianum]